MDESYDEGYEEGSTVSTADGVSEGAQKELRARFHYLKTGGSWDMLTTEAREVYLSGFEDAMKTLGVKP